MQTILDFLVSASYADGGTPIAVSYTEGVFDARTIIMGISLLVSFLALFIAFKSLNWQKHKQYIDQTLAVNDKYWHQSVVLPLFINRFSINVAEWLDGIDELENTSENSGLSLTIDNLRDKLKKDIRQLTLRTHLLVTVQEAVRTQILEELDDIEDCVTRYLSDLKENRKIKELPNTKIVVRSRNIFALLMKDHNQLNSDTK